ncbi:MAG: bifunctional phosphopantothenoylcysteine decarboxylase/phosphopantothenate--cysteine ligase CoaBC [Prevotellaceae bacterium]|jgi:phosphopantothenoylcysteine decarboxylase/phosphopantothenate--cysteine ligase|nr:bifunctional phosphopantothenoylcysteine decarboxylase/phosphopantothenate--cysteine ligase CoaBC [Prevotellaceae bacterium]
MLAGKHILVGITGGIAAYKTATLVRLFVKEGAEVKVVMTETAKQFITPLTMATLSKNPVLVDFFNPENGEWNSHVSLGLWADAYVIAPATANTVGKMAAGIADNLLLTTYLSAKCPVFVAPAMDLDMYKHPATLANIETLKSHGDTIIDAEAGELASGLEGKGRMAEPETIVACLNSYFDASFSGLRVLVTAGPTYEKIDPVRFISNYSSGKMGYAIAETLAQQGADVILVSGPTHLSPLHPNIRRVNVVSANEMYEECVHLFPSCNIAVMCAAVADFTLENQAENKIKQKTDLTISLTKTKDIAAKLGRMKNDEQILAGFALETENEVDNAYEKLSSKNLDFIVLNSLNDTGSGFGVDTNKIMIIDSDGTEIRFDTKPKKDVAKDIASYILKKYGQIIDSEL